MSAYISVVFEKTRLITSDQVRVVVRNRDDGLVPPLPGVSHYPTQPDALRNFIVGLFINNVTGESFSRIATTSDITTITVRQLDTLKDTGVNLTAASVEAGDLLYVYLTDSELWTSQEYTDTSPHVFQVASVIDSVTLTTTKPFPAHASGFTWTIPTRSVTGTAGVTLRNGQPANGTEFLDQRFNRLYTTVVDAENSVIAMRAGVQALTNEVVGDALVSTTETVSATI